jgi:HK97 family phage prohead protease
MAFKKTFVVSDESVNTYGFWVRTEGIRLENANKNCPCYFNHETWDIPLGHWENFRVDKNGQLLADLVIEGNNELEKEYIRKIQNGDIKGASVGLDPVSWSEEPTMLKQGQTRPFLDDSELFEISITPLPGNKNALALKNKGSLISLSGIDNPDFIPDLNTHKMKQIALKLGLPENATEAQILEKIAAIQLQAANTEALQKHVDAEAADVLESDEQKKLFTQLSKTDVVSALSFLALSRKPAKADAAAGTEGADGKVVLKKDVKVTDLIKQPAAGVKDDETNTFDYLQKKNPAELARIRREEPEKYAQLTADYGKGVRYKGK